MKTKDTIHFMCAIMSVRVREENTVLFNRHMAHRDIHRSATLLVNLLFAGKVDGVRKEKKIKICKQGKEQQVDETRACSRAHRNVSFLYAKKTNMPI